MAKRQAEESLEEIDKLHSPASKKARVENGTHSPVHTNGTIPDSNAPFKGVIREINDCRGLDILGAAEVEQEELEEAAQTPAPPEDDEDRSVLSAPSRQNAPLEGYTDLYLDTINRSVLDFDFEKLCSVTLSNINVYACLVCGRYYQGRGPKSHAYFHALEVGHHVYVNMQSKKVYVLPEGYEVKSKSLEDIKFVVDPRLSKDVVGKLDREVRDAWDLAGKKYRPGGHQAWDIAASCFTDV
jgi:U4/U6.U5 tri-snRNP-associated protein 2